MFCPACGTRATSGAITCTLCGALLPGHTAEEARARVPVHARVPEPVRYGGFWRRLAALLLDALVLYFPAAIVRVLLGLPAINSMTSTMNVDSSLPMIASAVELFMDWLYVAFLVASRSRATLGMMVMDLQVSDLHGARISFSRATWRYFAQFLSVITLFIGYFMQPFNARRQTLHDMLSGTVVVRPAHEPAPARMPALGLVP